MADKHPLPTHNVRIKKLKSLLAIVENSIRGGPSPRRSGLRSREGGDNYLFRNLYADENGKEIDILENGRNSCAVFVSWILLTLELIKRPHSTVYATEKDLISSGWHEIKEIKPGAIAVWEKRPADKGLLGNKNMDFAHIGFCVSKTEAISNDSKGRGFPWKHHITYNGTRKIEKIYWHPALNDET